MALITCAECQSEISDKALACVKCGAPVAEQLLKKALPVTTGTCPNCNTVNPLDAQKCLECGALFTGDGAWKLLAHVATPFPRYEGSYELPDSSRHESRPQLVKSAKSRGVYVILGLFFGLLGVHNFYAGRFGVGATQLLVTCILGWFVVGLVITAIWVLADLFLVDADGAGDALA